MKLRSLTVVIALMMLAILCPTYASAATSSLKLVYNTPSATTLEEDGYTWDGLTLTLENLSLSTGSTNAISITGVPSNVTSVVVLEGKNTLSSTGYALTTSGQLALEGSGSLYITKGKVSCAALYTQSTTTLNLASGTSLDSSGVIVNRGKITGSGSMSVPSGTLAINYGSGTCAPTIANASTSVTGGNISVNSAWYYTLFHSTQSGNGWEWNSSSDTLTLSSGSIFQFSSGSLMDLPSGTTVVINGNVTLICDDANSAALALGSSNGLQLNSGASLTIISKGTGITSSNALNTTNGTLNILSTKNALTTSQGGSTLGNAYLSSEAVGFSCAGNLTISGATTVSGKTNGIYLPSGGLTVNEGAILFASTSSSGSAVYTSSSVTNNGTIGLQASGNGIYTPSGSITLKNAHVYANVTGNPLLFYGGTFNMSGGTVTVSSLTNGIYAPNGIYLSNGAKVTLARADHSGAVAISGDISITGGSSLTALDVGVNAVYAAKGIVLDGGSSITVDDAGQKGIHVAGGDLTLTDSSSITVNKTGSSGVNIANGNLTTADGCSITVGTTGDNGIAVTGLADLYGNITVKNAGNYGITSTGGSVAIHGNTAVTAKSIGIYGANMVTSYDTCTLTVDAGGNGVVTKNGALTLACAPNTDMKITAKGMGVVSGSTATLAVPGFVYITAGSIGIKAESTIVVGGSPNETSFLSVICTQYSIYSTDGNVSLLACLDAYRFDYYIYTNEANRKSLTLGDGAAVFFGMNTGFAMGIVRKDLNLTSEYTGDLMSLNILQVANGYTFTIAADATLKTGPIVTGLETVVVAEPGSTVFYAGENGIVEGETTAYLTTALDLSTTSAIEDAAASIDSISWDGETLTLDGLVLDVADGTALTLPDDVTIALTDATSLITVGSDATSAIACSGDLDLTGDGTLVISGGQTTLDVDGDLTLSGGTLSVSGSTVAAIAADNLNIADGTLSVIAPSSSGIVATSGVAANDATLTFQTDGAAIAALGGDIVLTDCDVTAFTTDVALQAGGESAGKIVATGSALDLNSETAPVAAYVGSGSPAGVLQIDMTDTQGITTQDGWAVLTEDGIAITALAINGDGTTDGTTEVESLPIVTTTETDGTIVATLTYDDGTQVTTTQSPDGTMVSTIILSDSAGDDIYALPDDPGDVSIPDDTEEDASSTQDSDVDLSITIPDGETGVSVTLPTPNVDADDYLPLLVDSEGNTTPILFSVPTDDGMLLSVSDDCTISFATSSILFTDVAQSAWYHDDVYYVAYRSLFTGTTETTFSPDTPVTRSELVNAMWQLSGAPETTYVASFPDIADATYADAVNWCTQEGLIAGIDGYFAPDQSITRQELATFLYRYVTYLGLDTSASGELYRFTDGDQVSDWAWDAATWAVGEGILTGRNGSVLDPTGTTTRAEVAAMFQRCVQAMID